MQPDPAYLRRHYASLSDEALLDLNRSELVEAAQRCYDDEIEKRGLASLLPSPKREKPAETAAVNAPLDSDEDKPDWLDDAEEVTSWMVVASTRNRPWEEAAEVLTAAEIPFHLDFAEIEEDGAEPAHQVRLLVPAKLNLLATSILERDIYNQRFESAWRTHLELLSDDELRAEDLETTFCGLYDRIERINRAYREELARRGIRLDSVKSRSAT